METFNTQLGEKDFTDKKVEDALAKVTLKAFNNDKHAYRRQVQYMRYQLYFTTSNFKTFENRLKQLNKYNRYFPIPLQKRTAISCQWINSVKALTPWSIINKCSRIIMTPKINLLKSSAST